MKRFGIVIASSVVAVLLGGCGGGIQEGQPAGEDAGTPQPSGFQKMMQQNSKNMQLKSQGSPKKKKAGATQ
jgi:hypothetical protein